jgi:hypothetical protein
MDDRLRVIGQGMVHTNDPASARRPAPSFFADPAAWLVLAAIEAALGAAPATPVDATDPADAVGVIAVSEVATGRSIGEVAAGAARGRVSPLRFAGANPGSLAGVACHLLGLRGPSMVLTMPPADGLPVAELLAAGWLARGAAGRVVVATYQIEAAGRHTAHARALAPGGAG